MSVNIYGCGGAGIDVTTLINIDAQAPGFAKFQINQIDTSLSNLNRSASQIKSQFHIPGLDGAGKDKRYAMQHCEPQIPSILQLYPPAGFNIVVFSLSGGSGSIIGPLIARELSKRGNDVVCLVIGNLTNGKESGNTLSGVATLQGIAKTLTSSIPVSFFFNTKETPMDHVDQSITKMVRALLVLCSGSNHSMDSRDIHNWINFHKHTSIPPQLVQLSVLAQRSDEEVTTSIEPISTLSLLLDKSVQQLELNQAYGSTGWIAESVKGSTKDPKSLHFLLSNNELKSLFDGLVSINQTFIEQEEEMRLREVPLVGKSDDDSGFVF